MLSANRRRGYEPIGESYHILRSSSPEEIYFKIFGYKHNSGRLFVYHVFCILFLGIPYLIFSLYPKYGVIKLKRCPIQSAEIILIGSGHGNYTLTPVYTEKITLRNRGSFELRYFEFQHSKYFWNGDEWCFSPIERLVAEDTLEDILENTGGCTDKERHDLLKLYGPNKVEVEIKSYWQLFKEEVFSPFYIFQIFSIVLWCFDDYISYALCVLFLTILSATTALLETRKQSTALHDLVESSSCCEIKIQKPNFINADAEYNIDPILLVPGDVIVLPSNGMVMPCDAVLLSGHCIVNESMLTGESTPVTKTPPPCTAEYYNPDVHKRHTLFCGTQVMQTRFYQGEPVLARVVRTGFNTAKGSLVKSILFPAPVGLQFYKDSLKFVSVLFFIAAFGMGYCLYLYIVRSASVGEIILRTLDIITIVVPPALPAAMTIGTVYSQNRLKKLKIFCISPPRINVCGKLKLACFDKTGTLTHDGLDLDSVIPCDKNFGGVVGCEQMNSLSVKSPLIQAMATCHSLTRIEGEITGDPLDLVMFNSIDWELEEPEGPESSMYDKIAPTVVKPRKNPQPQPEPAFEDVPYEIGIIKQFPFSSSLQCMSVICRVLGSNHMTAFAKGAPEKIYGMCLRQSVPYDYAEKLAEYTAQGYRVIAVAYKPLSPKLKFLDAERKIKREAIESDLIFVGLLIMQNGLKPETAPVIRCLHNANIRTVMITGDNIYTAISVARNCDMISKNSKVFLISVENVESSNVPPRLYIEHFGSTHISGGDVAIPFDDSHLHFAIDGKSWSKLRVSYPDYVDKLLVRTTIFARFQPDQKTQLITSLQKLDYVVSMVGDGANDCGALKAAHVGVSLSEAEASVAAPFTSSVQNISCLVHLMLEGRCALVTSFAAFKYMALYSLIQFFTILILYKHHSILGDYQFLFIDLVITTSLAITIGLQGPAKKLVAKRPMGSLVCAKNVLPLFLQVILCGAMQLAALYYLFFQEWFRPLKPGKEEVVVCWENTVLFTVSCYQYVILACVYSKGKPYRERLITNFLFLLAALTLTCFITWLVIYPPKVIAEFFEVIYLPYHILDKIHVFKYSLLLFPVGHMILAMLIEVCIADREYFKKVFHVILRKKTPRNRYKILLNDTNFVNTFIAQYK